MRNRKFRIPQFKGCVLNFIDFCSGIGGGRLGLERNGFKCLGFSEIDKNAILKTKEKNYA